MDVGGKFSRRDPEKLGLGIGLFKYFPRIADSWAFFSGWKRKVLVG